MPIVDLNGLNRFLSKAKTLINEKIANISTPTPWKYSYNTAGDVLGLVRDVEAHSVTKSVLPYAVEATGVTDEANAYHDTTNETYASMPTGTDSRTAKIYIDTQIPQTVSNATILFKIGTSNISQAVWNERKYTVKCGGVTLAHGDFPLKTMGTVITVTGTLTSPIIEIDITAKTTVDQYVRIFGAQMNATYTATKEWISLIRNNQLAK